MVKMNTQELIKQAEELLSKCPPAPFEVQDMVNVEESYGECIGIKTPANKEFDSITLYGNFCLDEFDVKCLGDFLAFARNHMQELIDRLKKYEAALEFYANENNTVRLCVVDEKWCANVDLCEKAKQALLATQDGVSNPDEPNIFIEHKL